MTTLEKTYSLFSPADGGGEKSLGGVRAILSRLSAQTAEEGDTVSLREAYVACVLRENTPLGGFARGMRLVRNKREYTVESAVESSRLWVLRLSRTLTDGEA